MTDKLWDLPPSPQEQKPLIDLPPIQSTIPDQGPPPLERYTAPTEQPPPTDWESFPNLFGSLTDERQNYLEQWQHLATLRTTYVRRLRILELQQARFGLLQVPPHLVIEIEDTHQIIAKINRQLKDLHDIITANSGKETLKQDSRDFQAVKIVFPGDLDLPNLSKERISAVVITVASILGISPEQVIFITATVGSIVFELTMPREAVVRLIALATVKQPAVKDAGIVQVYPVISSDVSDLQEIKGLVSEEVRRIAKEMQDLAVSQQPGNSQIDEEQLGLEKLLLQEQDSQRELEILEQLYKHIQRKNSDSNVSL